MLRRPVLVPVLLSVSLAAGALCAQPPVPTASADSTDERTQIQIRRAQGHIEIDGDLNDPGWVGAARHDTFYETNPGDNIPARVKNVGYLAYDDRYFYAAFEFEDPDLSKLRAPYGDHDAVPGYTDYGGVILDTRNDAKTAVLLLVNPHNIQYDAQTNDASGEDPSLDLYWDSATKITDKGWVVEMRVPFSSLRYTPQDPQKWGILLYRNWPRQYRTQMFSAKLPRGSNCFICHRNDLVGLEGLPRGQHYILAPYATGRRSELPAGPLGAPLDNTDTEWDGGLDAKWTLNADTAIDATINPDFSQVESDVAQIGVNERFALFFAERRPFFLERLDLFKTPIQVVYTRTVTSPRWGLRATGEAFDTSYTLLLAEDRGGGSVVIPGPEFSTLADQDFQSKVLIGRLRRDFGASLGSFVLTGREIEGGGHNYVLGPDFQWRPNAKDTVTGQFLLSDSETPNRPDLAGEWNGQSLSSHLAYLAWNHNTPTWDWTFEGTDIGDEFRADEGYVPQVGYRDGWAELGRSWFFDKRLFRGFRPYVRTRLTTDRDGDVLLRRQVVGGDTNGYWNSRINAEYHLDEVRAGGILFDRQQLTWSITVNPSRTFSQVAVSGVTGEEVDFANLRPGDGTSLTYSAIVRPTEHLDLRFNGSYQWLDVRPGAELGRGTDRQRLFTAQVARLRATYTFNSRTFLRLIGQQTQVERDPAIYLFPVRRNEETFSGSALFAYKLNWQTVLFVGYGDERALDRFEDLQPASRQLFFKVSYAFQR